MAAHRRQGDPHEATFDAAAELKALLCVRITIICQNGYRVANYVDSITDAIPYHCVHCPRTGTDAACTYRLDTEIAARLPGTTDLIPVPPQAPWPPEPEETPNAA